VKPGQALHEFEPDAQAARRGSPIVSAWKKSSKTRGRFSGAMP
jgi:hypothetical protein